MDKDKWCQDKAVLFSTIAILAIIFVIGAVGNICACLVIIRTKSLHTRANYFLFSLACSDMLLLFLACPLQIYLFISCCTSSNFVCKFFHYIKDAYGVISVFIICAFTAERWLAVRHPLRLNELRNFSCAFAFVSTIALIIVIGLRMDAVSAGEESSSNHADFAEEMNSTFHNYADFSANTSTSSLPGDYHSILETSDNETTGNEKCGWIISGLAIHTTFILFIFSYIIPVIMLAIMCFQIAASARSASCNAQNECSRRTSSKMNKLLVAVVASFLICWSPHQILQLIDVLEIEHSVLWDNTINISTCCYYLNSAVNPILYNMFSKNFRRGLLHMISGGKPTAAAKATCSASGESNKTAIITYHYK